MVYACNVRNIKACKCIVKKIRGFNISIILGILKIHPSLTTSKEDLKKNNIHLGKKDIASYLVVSQV